MEMSRLSFELARLTGNRTRQETWLDGPGLLDATELDRLLLRLPADSLRNSSQWRKIVRYHCQVANQFQSFYISASRGQWLRTLIESPKPVEIFEEEDSEADLIIHSNVVPRQAYLKAPCPNPQRCRGFIPARAIVDGLHSHPSCESCALAEQLSGMDGNYAAAEELDPLERFWFLGVEEVEFVEDLGEGSEGKVSKIQWRRGVFVRKRFNLACNMDRELDVALRVSHPNIVHCFGCSRWTDSSDYDLFMELLDVDLYRYLFEERETGDESAFSFRDLLDVLLQVAQAMKHVHEMNFVHGDLKPHNIFLSCFELAHSGDRNYLVKVGDFGCAQRVDSSGATVEPFRSFVGSLRYTAPEVLTCRKGAAPPEHPQKIDVYSFGVVAYQVLTGIPDLYGRIRQKFLADEVIQGLRPDRNFKGALDGDRSSLLPLIRSCWNSNPEDRPSFSQICDELDGHVDKLQKKNAKRKHRSNWRFSQ